MTTDLTAAVDAAARIVIREAYPLHGWGDLTPSQQHRCRELVLPIVDAAAPLIEVAVREQVARNIESLRHQYDRQSREITHGNPSAYDQGVTDAYDLAAGIARGGA